MTILSQLKADNEATPRRYEIVAKSEESTEIYLYDAIGGFFGVDAGRFVRDLQAIKTPIIHLRVNSPGGEVNAARAIATAIAQHSSKVIAHVDGLAASSASFLILAANEIEISAGAFIMVHNPWAMTVGDSSEHESTAELLRKYEASMVADYSRRTGKDEKTVRKWMEDETWFDAAEAVDAGLADRVVETIPAKAEWNLSAFKNAPDVLSRRDTVIAGAGQPDSTEVQGSAPDDHTKEGLMPNPTQPKEETQGQIQPQSAEAIQAAVAAERSRVAEISRIGAGAKMTTAEIQAAINNGTTLEAFKTKAIDTMAARETGSETQVGVTMAVTRDETDTRRALVAAAVLNRVNPGLYTVDAQNGYRAMTLMRMAEETLTASGQSIRGKSPNEIAVMAMHSSSDFPYVLENSLRKVLLDTYGAAMPTYRTWTRKSIATDFKTMRRIRRGEMPTLLEVPEGGEILMGSVGEERESYAIATYGRGVSFTRQMLINDDLAAFNDLAGGFGAQAARLENKTVYAILAANAAMNDSVTLFHADHGNSGTGAIGNTALAAMFAGMARQTGVDGVTYLNIKPKWLIVPPELESAARTSQIAIGPNVKASDQNHYAGRLEVVADAELTNATKWYGAAETRDIEYSHLAGAEGPQFVREENAGGVLGVKFYAFLDFGAKATDWRGLWYSTGS